MAQMIDGKAIAARIREEVKAGVEELRRQGKTVTLAVIQVGEDPASCVYVRNKEKACRELSIHSLIYRPSESIPEGELLALVEELNGRTDVDGVLVQLPLPAHISEKKVLMAIDPSKDVDGFHPYNTGALACGEPGFVPCTPAGIIQLLKRSGISISGKECVVIGRSNIVGKPVAQLLLRENGTVTIAHSKTENLKEVASRAEILVVATGKAEMITREYVRPGAAVIDVGIHRDEHNRLRGDVNFADVFDVAGAITPVPGGVGPMTIAMLMQNCLEGARRSFSEKPL